VTLRLALVALAATIAVALANAGGPAVAAVGGSRTGQTVVSLTFDDGPKTQYSVRQTLRSHGVRATFFVNSGLMSDDPGAWRMTWTQLHDLAADGNEIAAHGLTGQNLTLLTPDQQRQQICNDRVNLIKRGFAPATSFAYPYGAYNSGAESIVKDCGYTSARTLGGIRSSLCPSCAFSETIPPADPFATRTLPDIRNTTSLATMEAYVTQAENNGGGWVQLVFGSICSDCGDYGTSLAQVTAFLDWLQPRAANGTVVKTVSAAMRDMPSTALPPKK
jgi:peptidoglycan/xylan/chitin deacetylase (PgdA/CDA1 family)